MKNQKLFFKLLSKNATLPSRRSALAAGYYLHCIEGFDLEPAARAACRTGISVAIPRGYYGRVTARSGLAERFSLAVLAGTIDSDYRGEISVLLINLGTETVVFRDGSRIAQLIVEKISTLEPAWADELSETGGGSIGFWVKQKLQVNHLGSLLRSNRTQR